MATFVHYVGRFQDIRGRFVGLPGWARALVWLAALPGRDGWHCFMALAGDVRSLGSSPAPSWWLPQFMGSSKATRGAANSACPAHERRVSDATAILSRTDTTTNHRRNLERGDSHGRT